MKYDHMVKVDGQYYPAGVEIPELDACTEQSAEVEETLESESLIDDKESPESPPAKRGRKPAASQ